LSPASALAPRPLVAAPGPWRFPVPGRVRLDSGLTVLWHDLPGQHVASVTCHLGIPLGAEPEGRDGIAAVMASCLGPATPGMAGTFARQAAGCGITWETAASPAGPSLMIDVPVTHLPQALHMLGQALTTPGPDHAEVPRITELAAARLLHARTDPQHRAGQELAAAIYGPATRAGRPAAGTPGSVQALTPEAIADFAAAHARPGSVIISAAGDLRGLDMATLAGEALGGWRDPRPCYGQVQPWPVPRRGPAAVLIDQPGAAQAQLLAGIPVPGRGEPGWAELHVAAHILGAPVNGRLDSQIRDGSGDSYGIRATVTELGPGAGVLTAGGAVAAQSAPQALGDILAILTEPLRSGFPAIEHAAATQAITRTVPLGYDTPSAIAAATAELAAAGLPPGYPDLLLEDITALHPGHTTSAYKAHISPDRLTLIAVGDAALLAGPLQELAGPAPLEVIST
jgi:predicted Zn-dependent peptidase